MFVVQAEERLRRTRPIVACDGSRRGFNEGARERAPTASAAQHQQCIGRGVYELSLK